MKYAGLLLAVMGILALGVSRGTAQEEPVPGRDGWISMFDGKTLDGWKANENPESWKVSAVTCSGWFGNARTASSVPK